MKRSEVVEPWQSFHSAWHSLLGTNETRHTFSGPINQQQDQHTVKGNVIIATQQGKRLNLLETGCKDHNFKKTTDGFEKTVDTGAFANVDLMNLAFNLNRNDVISICNRLSSQLVSDNLGKGRERSTLNEEWTRVSSRSRMSVLRPEAASSGNSGGRMYSRWG